MDERTQGIIQSKEHLLPLKVNKEPFSESRGHHRRPNISRRSRRVAAHLRVLSASLAGLPACHPSQQASSTTALFGETPLLAIVSDHTCRSYGAPWLGPSSHGPVRPGKLSGSDDDDETGVGYGDRESTTTCRSHPSSPFPPPLSIILKKRRRARPPHPLACLPCAPQRRHAGPTSRLWWMGLVAIRVSLCFKRLIEVGDLWDLHIVPSQPIDDHARL